MEGEREIAEEKIEEGWIDAWFAFEVVAITKEAAQEALKKHIEKLGKLRSVILYEKKFSEPKKIEKFSPKIKEAWSQIAETRIAIKSFFDLINIVILYAPSAIEIHSPKEFRVKLEEVQNIANLIAGLIHQFAAAKIGGVVIKT